MGEWLLYVYKLTLQTEPSRHFFYNKDKPISSLVKGLAKLYPINNNKYAHCFSSDVCSLRLCLTCNSFLTMEQTRKPVLLLSSDPKVPSLPLVGV